MKTWVGLAISLLLYCGLAGAQDDVLVDQVIARVNSDIITLSNYRRTQTERREELKQSGLTGQPLEDAYERHLKVLLAEMIDTQLLGQRASELSINVEADINKYIIDLATQQGLAPSKADEMLRTMGVDPDQARQILRTRFLREAVLNREVYASVFQGVFDREVDEHYAKRQDEFADPETVKLEEVFIAVRGRTREIARKRAAEVVTQLRSGADLAALAKEFSDRPSREHGGDIGTFKLTPAPDLAPLQAAAILPLKPGEITDPIELPDGFQILKVVERKPKVIKPLDEALRRQIKFEIARERAKPAVEAYIEKLRGNAYICIVDEYRPADSSFKSCSAAGRN
ncbi:MAG: peptidyl-prolyl cis-trans isomerase [Acidobacteria bacterium]|nr:peptidyl-prolyl cis-trans isomerase [Acidobacteriota bacterium]